MKSADKIFSLFTLAVFIGLLLPVLLKDGMFLDGVTYSCISKNLANNIGELWKPHYTKTLYPAFYEHPPLVFGIQSCFLDLWVMVYIPKEYIRSLRPYSSSLELF